MSSSPIHAIHPTVRAETPTRCRNALHPRAETALSSRWKAAAFVLLLAAALSWPLQHAGGDLWIADHIYRWQGGRWALRDAWLLSTLLHDGGRRLSGVCWLAAVAAWAAGGRWMVPYHWRRPLGYLAATVLASTLIVSLLKHFSGVDCPWDLLLYGGTRTYLTPFSPASLGAPGACFPAGHASAGFAWVAAGFALAARPRRARLAWGLALAAGLAFGITQQLRGAHFLSHDIWTAALCWAVAAAMSTLRRWRDLAAPGGGTVPPRTARSGI